jgi:hypothetical protein
MSIAKSILMSAGKKSELSELKAKLKTIKDRVLHECREDVSNLLGDYSANMYTFNKYHPDFSMMKTHTFKYIDNYGGLSKELIRQSIFLAKKVYSRTGDAKYLNIINQLRDKLMMMNDKTNIGPTADLRMNIVDDLSRILQSKLTNPM